MNILQKLQQDRIFYYSVLLFAFALPLSRAAISFFVLWFILLFIVRNEYREIWEFIKSNRVFHAMGLFIGFLYLSLLWSNDISEGLKQARLYSYWIIIPILAVTLKKEWLSKIITAFLGGMFVSEVLAYGIYFGLWSINGHGPDYPSPFMTHIHYSIFLATTSIILLNRLLSDRYTWHSKLPMLLFFLTATGNLMFSTGRTGQLAFFIALVVAVLLHFRLTFKSFFVISILSATLFTAAYTQIYLFKNRADLALSDIQALQSGNYSSSWGWRAAFWVVTYDIIREHPLVGVGLGDYRSAAMNALNRNDHNFDSHTIEWCKSTHFHNQYLMIVTQTGLLGFAFMIWLLIELFRLRISDIELKKISILALSVFVVGCIAEPLWILQFPIILYVLIVSISLAASNQSLSTKEP